MNDLTIPFDTSNSVDYFHYITPTKKLICASYDAQSGMLSKTYSVEIDGKRVYETFVQALAKPNISISQAS